MTVHPFDCNGLLEPAYFPMISDSEFTKAGEVELAFSQERGGSVLREGKAPVFLAIDLFWRGYVWTAFLSGFLASERMVSFLLWSARIVHLL